MLKIGSKSKIEVHWKVSPYDFSQDNIKKIQTKFSKKYCIPKDHIKVFPVFSHVDENGNEISITNDVINNIQNIDFQQNLFKEYLSENNILDYDFSFIQKIDAEINSKINYDVYEKYRKYSIKWIKWNNFLSYGENNFFDFSSLKGLVLLNGDPANQSGKTTFAIDLLHFLLYGKTTKSATQDKIFNKFLPENTEVIVEGCINVDGEDYIIKRRLTRPSLPRRTSKSKTIQKVEYYKIVEGVEEELADYVENQQEETNLQTNKAIKEVIGSEEDFDMIICATSNNLDNLIEKKETDRGKLLSRWIGLLPLEQKDIIARDIYNSSIKKYFKSNIYDTQTLQIEINKLSSDNQIYNEEIGKYLSDIDKIEKDLSSLEEQKLSLLSAKSQIDNNLLKIDIVTLNNQIELCKNKGIKKSAEKQDAIEKLKNLQNIDFSINDYNALSNKKTQKTIELNDLRNEFKYNKNIIQSLINDEFCPTCGRKYDNIDNSEKINHLTKVNNELTTKGAEITAEIQNIEKELDNMQTNSEKYKTKSNLEVLIPSLDVSIANLRLEYKDLTYKLTEYKKNKEAIDKNNQIDINIRNIDIQIKDKQNTKNTCLTFINENKIKIENNNQKIKEREVLIKDIQEEKKVEKNWRIYLDMIGKNGISKMVLRKTLPIINAQICRLLTDVCDFDVIIEINDRNDIIFSIIKDNVKSDIMSGSGFEKTAAALAIRAVLGNISTLPKCNILVLDEILGRVAKENYDNMRLLYDKILENFDSIIQISHLEEIKDWHNTIITVKKENNISRLSINYNE